MTNIPHIIEVALLLLLVYVLGCVIGAGLRRLFATESQAESAPSAPAPADKPTRIASPVSPDAPRQEIPKPKPSAAPGRPETLSAPRGGAKDNLKQIKGIGPKIEGMLNDLGVYHFDQVAAWDKKSIAWINESLSFKGRVEREQWVSQAKALTKKKT